MAPNPPALRAAGVFHSGRDPKQRQLRRTAMPLYHVQRIVVVRHADGLHARPAEMVARQAMQYRSRIELVRDHLRIDARSILNILTLGAECGVQLVVEAEGDDAEEAAAGVARLIEGEFNTETPSELAGPCGEGD